jgi:Flp pilus assembly pilin Flp
MGAAVRFFRWFLNLHFIRSESGANAAEFAMVAMPMAIMTLVILQVGSLFFAYNDIHNAAREGARRLAVQDGVGFGDNTGTLDVDGPVYRCDGTGTAPDPGTVEDIVCGRLAGWDNRVGVSIRANSPAPPADPALGCSEVTVSVVMNMSDAALFSVFGLLAGRQMRAEATMISEYQMTTNEAVCDT